jgi:GNAT superfamily N-acetyltransferase
MLTLGRRGTIRMQISQLTEQNLEPVLAAWNAALQHDPLDVASFRRVFLEDPNHEPEGTWVLEGSDGRVCGFAHCVVRRTVEGKDGGGRDYEFASGFLKGFFAVGGPDDAAVADRLLANAEAYCAAANKEELRVTEYAGPYVYPGLDVRYERLRSMLSERGYRDVRTIEDVAADLRDTQLPVRLARLRERVGPRVKVCTWDPALLPSMRKFVAEGDQPQWFRLGWEKHLAETREETLVLRRGGGIVGWAHYWPSQPRAGFGPILVLPRARGNGYGGFLLLECMERARRQGSETMSAGWANAGFYTANGWHITRRYAVLRKLLDGGCR